MTAVIHIVPGDHIVHADGDATFVAQTQHPIWPRLQLVIWRMGDGTWSHDALSPAQDVGQVQPSTNAQRTQRLRAVLLGEAAAVEPTIHEDEAEDLQTTRMEVATALWRQELPGERANVLPDLGNLLAWLMERQATLTVERDEARAEFDRVWTLLHGARTAARRLTAVLIANASYLDTSFSNADGSPWTTWTTFVKPAINGLRDALGMRGAWPTTQPCCDLHGRKCEQPYELCCTACTEAAHPSHADGSVCSAPDLSGTGYVAANALREQLAVVGSPVVSAPLIGADPAGSPQPEAKNLSGEQGGGWQPGDPLYANPPEALMCTCEGILSNVDEIAILTRAGNTPQVLEHGKHYVVVDAVGNVLAASASLGRRTYRESALSAAVRWTEAAMPTGARPDG